MKYRRDASAVPTVMWLVGALEVLAPADWSEAQVRAGLRGILVRSPVPIAVARVAPGSLRYALKSFFDGGEEIDGHRWVATMTAAWRDDAPPPSFDPDEVRYAFTRDSHDSTDRKGPRVPKQVLEGFLRGRAMKRRAFDWPLSRVPDEPLRDGAMFVRSDGAAVWISADYAPWWPLTLEQGDDPMGMIRVTVEGETVAYLMPFTPRPPRQRRTRRVSRA